MIVSLVLEQELNSDSIVSLEEEIPADEDVAIEAAVADDHSADKPQGTSAAGSSASRSNSKKREIPAAAGRRVHSERRTWNHGEITAVRRQLQSNIILMRVPTKGECEKAIENEPELSSRTWKGVKFCVHNLIMKRKKGIGRRD